MQEREKYDFQGGRDRQVFGPIYIPVQKFKKECCGFSPHWLRGRHFKAGLEAETLLDDLVDAEGNGHQGH
jgi:hypothetical protein